MSLFYTIDYIPNPDKTYSCIDNIKYAAKTEIIIVSLFVSNILVSLRCHWKKKI